MKTVVNYRVGLPLLLVILFLIKDTFHGVHFLNGCYRGTSHVPRKVVLTFLDKYRRIHLLPMNLWRPFLDPTWQTGHHLLFLGSFIDPFMYIIVTNKFQKIWSFRTQSDKKVFQAHGKIVFV